MEFNSEEIRSYFPSIKSGSIFFDNPGGTQVPQEVMDAVTHHYRTSNANLHQEYETSKRTDEVIRNARKAMADFLNARSHNEIVFGQNMTSLTFSFSRALGKTLNNGDEIIVTRLDHDANVSPWLFLKEQGATIRWIDVNTNDCTLDMSDFQKKINPKTRIVAVGYASNAMGSINNLKEIIKLARSANALVFIDAVHYAPHGPIDVQELDCDFLACSAYKFYGPHVGILYGKYELLDRLDAYKVRPAKNTPPDKFETGTQNFEGLSGVCATVNFLASIGEDYGKNFKKNFGSFSGRSLNLKTAMTAIKSFERELFERLLTGLKQIQGINIYGISDPEQFALRTPTLAFTLKNFSPHYIAKYLAEENIYVWHGNYYALALMERLGLEETGGAVRIGLGIYNTQSEVNHFLSVLKKIH